MQKVSWTGLGPSKCLIVISMSAMSKQGTKIQLTHPRRRCFNISDTDSV